MKVWVSGSSGNWVQSWAPVSCSCTSSSRFRQEDSPLDDGHVPLIEQSDHVAIPEGYSQCSGGWKQMNGAVKIALLEPLRIGNTEGS